MKLGNHTIGLRKLQPRLGEDGEPVRDDLGDAVIDVVDVEVRWCLVTPTTRTRSDTTEPPNRTAPAITGTTVLVPVKTDVDMVDVVIWPITGKETVDGQLKLTGRLWQVVGEPHRWGDCLQVEMGTGT